MLLFCRNNAESFKCVPAGEFKSFTPTAELIAACKGILQQEGEFSFKKGSRVKVNGIIYTSREYQRLKKQNAHTILYGKMQHIHSYLQSCDHPHH